MHGAASAQAPAQPGNAAPPEVDKLDAIRMERLARIEQCVVSGHLIVRDLVALQKWNSKYSPLTLRLLQASARHRCLAAATRGDRRRGAAEGSRGEDSAGANRLCDAQ